MSCARTSRSVTPVLIRLPALTSFVIDGEQYTQYQSRRSTPGVSTMRGGDTHYGGYIISRLYLGLGRPGPREAKD